MSHPALPLTPTAPRRHGPVLFVLAVIVFGTFARLLGSDFTWFDDQQTLHQNPMFNPAGWHTIVDTWTKPHMGLYVPVTYTVWTVIALFAQLQAADEFNVMLNPTLFHMANLLWHMGATWMVYFLLRRLLATRFETDVTLPAAFGAALFAAHPLQTEVLGWISGMKDLLCWFGLLAATLLYVRRTQSVQAADDRGDLARPLWKSWEMPVATVVFVLAILSKPSAVVTPAAMLAIGVLALRRHWKRATLEVLPLFAISAITVYFARQHQWVGTSEHVPLWQRPFVAGDAATFYLTKLFAPFSLTIDYGRRPTLIVKEPMTYVRWIVPTVLAIAAVLVYRRQPLLTLAAVLAAIGIAPVSGMATFQMQQFSTTTDHYVYFSMVGPALILAWGLARWPTVGMRIAALVLVALLIVRSFDQSQIWKNTFALFEHASTVRPRSLIAQNNLAAVHMGKMMPDYLLARRHVEKALEIDPKNYYALQNYGIITAKLRDKEASNKAFDTLWSAGIDAQAGREAMSEVAGAGFEGAMILHDFDRAIMWAERAIGAMPNDFRNQSKLAEARKAKATRDAATKPTTTTAPAPVPASAPSR